MSYQLGDAAQGQCWAIGNALESRSDSLTSVVEEAPRTWPFVTVNHFEVQGENTRRETRSSIFAFAPLLRSDAAKEEWNTNYSAAQGDAWLQTSYTRAVQTAGPETEEGQAFAAAAQANKGIPEAVYRVEGNNFPAMTLEDSPEDWLPLWQISPPPLDPSPINFNLLSSPDVAQVVNYVSDHQVPVLSDRFLRDPVIRHWVQQYDEMTPEHDHVVVHDYDVNTDHETHQHDLGTNPDDLRRLDHEEVNGYNADYDNKDGHLFLVYPIFDTVGDASDPTRATTLDIIGSGRQGDNITTAGRQLTGIYLELVRWDWMLTDALHATTEPVLAVLKNTCGEGEYTYSVNGMDAYLMGVGDGTTEKFGNDEIRSPVKHFKGLHAETNESCDFYLYVYPTKVFRESFASDQPTIFTFIVALAFAITALFFFFYVRIVQRRQTKVMATAARTNAIVTSLFPSNVRDRIMKDAEDAVNNKQEMAPFLPGMGEGATKKLKTFLDEENPAASNDNQLIMFKTKPIADLFPETTVMFADLVGFTAWSRYDVIYHCYFYFAAPLSMYSHNYVFFKSVFVNRHKYFNCSKRFITVS